MENEDRDKPWNFHTCNTCPYRSRSIFLMGKHVGQHKIKTKTDTFYCELKAPEKLECQHCVFKTDLKVTLRHHIKVRHEKEKEENVTFTNVLECYKCKNCDHQTYSLLVMVKHIHSFKHVVDQNFIKKIAKLHSFHLELHSLEMLKCQHCAFETNLKVLLQHHINVTHEERQENIGLRNLCKSYNCKNCDFQTYSLLIITEHLDSLNHVIDENFIEIQSGDKNSANRFYKCEHCLHKSEMKQELLNYVIPVHSQRFRCEWCPFKSLYITSIKNHIEQNHNISWANCDNCLRKSRNYITTHKHVLEEGSIRYRRSFRFKCECCKFKTTSNHELKIHVLLEHDQQFKCDQCSFQVRTRLGLAEHISLEHGKKFKCDKCSFQVSTSLELAAHISLQHGKKFKCDRCSFQVKTKLGLLAHISEHAKKFKCDQCSFQVRSKRGLTAHISLAHDRSKHFKCEQCSYETHRKKSYDFKAF